MNFFKIKKEISFLVLAGAMLFGVSAHATNLTDEATIKALPTAVENGSFENPVYGANKTYNNEKWNLKYDGVDGGITSYHTAEWFEGVAQSYHNSKFYWKTTASNDDMELWNGDKRFGGTNWNPLIHNAADGKQYAELNADEEATLYQNIQTVPGAVYKWGLSHSGRQDYNTMAVVIGPAQTDDSIKNASVSDSDPFMDMIHWLAKEVEHNETTVGCEGPHMVYSKELTANTTDSDDNFSLTQSADYPYEWKCWIITDSAQTWGNYGLNAASADYDFTYEVPAEQTATIFAFVSIHGTNDDETMGNFLDGIEFEKAYPLRVATTGGGTGYVVGTDYEGNTVNQANATVTYDNDYIGRFYEHDTPVVYAKADEGHKFLGAYYDGKLYTANDSNYNAATGEYYHKVLMNQPRYVQLIFTAESTVIYDPNGGTYDGKEEDTEIKMSADGTALVECSGDAEPASDDIQFIGWYFARGGQKDDGSYTGDLITSDHNVTYDAKSADITTDDVLVVEYTNTRGTTATSTVPVADGITFIAEWEYKQVVIPETKSIGDTEYSESDKGGTVTITITDSDNLSDSERTTDDGKNGSKYGWGRLADNVTMTATANEGYTFVGWYDTVTQEVVTHTNIYTYNVAEPRTVHAHFVQDEVSETSGVYLSYVAKSAETTAEDTPFDGTSHVVIEGTKQTIDGFGGDNYGNTLSTGFVATASGQEGASYQYCSWIITIPANETYFKNSGNTNYGFTVGTEKLANDSAKINTGAIYDVSNDVTLKLHDEIGTTITGNSVVMFGIVLDNVYAPNATAAFELSSDADRDGYTTLSDVVQAENIDDFQNNTNNIYTQTVE